MNLVEIKVRVLKNKGEEGKRKQKGVKMYGIKSGMGELSFEQPK